MSQCCAEHGSCRTNCDTVIDIVESKSAKCGARQVEGAKAQTGKVGERTYFESDSKGGGADKAGVSDHGQQPHFMAKEQITRFEERERETAYLCVL